MTKFLRYALPMVIVLAAKMAAAGPIVINDQMDSAATHGVADYGSYSAPNFANRSANGRHWGDEVYSPSHRFDTTKITVDRNDVLNKITFTLHTMFNGNDEGAAYADLFIDTATPNTPDSYGYAIALGYQTSPVGFYSVGSASTSIDIWSSRTNYVYGGYTQFKTTSPDFDATMAVPIYTRLNTGSPVPGYSVSVTRTTVADGFFDVTVVLQSLSDLVLFNHFDVLWGTGDCGNDSIWGSVNTAPVDAPPGLLLFGLGVLGLVGLRRQQRTRRSLVCSA